jgi:uncharacterized membrane protein
MKMSVAKGFMVFVMMMAAMAFAAAVPVSIDEVKLDGDTLDSVQEGSENILSLDRDDEFEVRVEVSADADVDDVQIEATIRGYDSDDMIEDITDVFDMNEGRTYIKRLTLSLPGDVDKDVYRLRIRVDSRDGDTTQEDYEIEVSAPRHSLQIKDVMFSPEEVMAGRSLLTTVRLRNTGSSDQDDGVKVQVRIPELGLTASDYIDEVDEDDSVTSEELFLRIPACVKPGVYDVEITAFYKDGDRSIKTMRTVEITAGDECEAAKPDDSGSVDEKPKTVITYGSLAQEVTAGQGGVIYPFMITNSGKESKTYVLAVSDYADWADVRITPANIMVVQPGQTKEAYVYVSAKEGTQAGEKSFMVTVSSDNEVLKQFMAKTVVKEAPAKPDTGMGSQDIRQWLLVTLLVLVVVLFVVGLIIVLTRLRGKDEGSDDEPKSYY